MVMKVGRRSRFIPNPAGYKALAYAMRSGEAMLKVAEAINGATNWTMSGPGQREWQVEKIVKFEDQRGAVAGTRFPFAHLDEWGSVHNPPYASLRRGLGRVGLARKTEMS